MKRLRILATLHRYPPVSGGAEMHTHWLMKTLANKNQISIFARESDPARAEYDEREYQSSPFDVRLINVTKRAPFWAYYRDETIEARFKHIMQSFEPDIVFVGHTVGLSAALIDIATESRIPTIVHLRDFFYICHRLFLLKSDSSVCCGPLDGSKCAECMAPDIKTLNSEHIMAPGLERVEYMKRVLQKADLLFAHSNFLAQKHIEFGLPPHKVRVVEGGIDLKDLTKNYHKKAAERLRFGYLGNISTMKGVENLIDAFTKLPDDNSELHIWGSTPNIRYLDQLKLKAKTKRVHFHGEYDRNRIGEVLSSIDLLVHPSIVPEAYSLTIREAFAVKIPVIVSNLRAQSDAVRDRVDGLHFKAGIAEDLREKMRMVATRPKTVAELQDNILPVRSVEDQAEEMNDILLRLAEG